MTDDCTFAQVYVKELWNNLYYSVHTTEKCVVKFNTLCMSFCCRCLCTKLNGMWILIFHIKLSYWEPWQINIVTSFFFLKGFELTLDGIIINHCQFKWWGRSIGNICAYLLITNWICSLPNNLCKVSIATNGITIHLMANKHALKKM